MRQSLICHPDTPARSVRAVNVLIERTAQALSLCYIVDCPIEKLVLPEPAEPERRDGLWKTTCCELFLRDAAPGYREYNFSPSSQWAAYRFTARREGMEPLPLEFPPIIELADDDDDRMMLAVWLQLDGAATLTAAMSMVIQEVDGAKSCWALAHAPGQPDFHHPDCFVLELPPASAS